MRHLSVFVLTVSSLLPLAAAADPAKRDFEADAVGQPPAGFEFARTGGGAEGKWVVRTEKGSDKNHVLAQERADTTDNRFPVAVLKDGSYKDMALSVRARPLSGHVDQGFGLVNRVFDGADDTFKDAGKVGVWTDADSVIEFDDFTVEGR